MTLSPSANCLSPFIEHVHYQSCNKSCLASSACIINAMFAGADSATERISRLRYHGSEQRRRNHRNRFGHTPPRRLSKVRGTRGYEKI